MPRLSKIGAAALAAFGWTSGVSAVSASYLVVAGGGAGGFAGNGGGGGAGGFLTGTTSLNPTLSYTVTVGAGGTSVAAISSTNGSGSTFNAITATGGGAGGPTASGVGAGNTGGSGGGGLNDSQNFAGGSGTAGQGNAGGASGGGGAPYPGGGGGGASAAGTVGTSGGQGGAGTASSISGSSVTYAGGGGGARSSGSASVGGSGGGGNGGVASVGIAGTANLGGGGGGSGSGAGGQGGSGVVIISYVGAQQFGGGVVTSSGGNTIHTFTTSGTLVPVTPLTANFLVIAGGGGGGGDTGAGGGAGGYRTSAGTSGGGASAEATLTIDSNSIYLVTVGSGGAKGGASISGSSGGASSFYSISTTGGGGGGTNAVAGLSGGSGGGAGYGANGGAGTANQGYAGGNGTAGNVPNYGAGGGGGAGAVGVAGTTTTGGNGGAGVASTITGSSVTRAGGGGGGTFSGGTLGTGGSGGGGNAGASDDGDANTGSGGGGAKNNGTDSGNGGSGVVIISYAGATQLMAGGTVTITGGNVIHTFTSTGYLTPLKLVNNSLRFRSSASAYLNRTPTVASNRTTWTWTSWVKRGKLGSAQALFSAGTGTAEFRLTFTSSDTIEFYEYTSPSYNWQKITTAVYRDPAAWYQIQLVYDTTNSTAADRVKLYVNGVQVTSFGTNTNPTSSFSGYVNSVTPHGIASFSTGANYLDGYLTEINFIDGQALTPNSFGTFNSYGVWQPITYGGSYGTNGFYLPFNSGSSTFAGNFNGSSQYLSIASSSLSNFGTGNYTVEALICRTSQSKNEYVLGGTSTCFQAYINTTGKLVGGLAGTGDFTASTGSVPLNIWTHVAWVRTGTSLTYYINGVAAGTVSDSFNYSLSSTTVNIATTNNNVSFAISGAISNLRVVKGSAVYSSNFTPPTTNLTAITNTSLLTLQNATIVDNSTNGATITNTGTVTTGQTYPFSYSIFNDQSPQGNNWTPNNISGASGATLDYMTDVPTLTSATAANYAVMNPLNLPRGGTLSNGNLLWTAPSAEGQAVATLYVSSGKFYWEMVSNTAGGFGFGISIDTANINTINVVAGQYVYYNNGNKYIGATPSAYGATYTNGDIIGIALDLDAGTLVFYKNNVSQGTATTGLSGAFTALIYDGSSAATPTFTANFGQRPFTYTAPSGYVALNTYNL